MALFTLTERAKEDLKEIGRYTEAKWGRSQRNKYLGSRHHVFQQLPPIHSKEKIAATYVSGIERLTQEVMSSFTEHQHQIPSKLSEYFMPGWTLNPEFRAADTTHASGSGVMTGGVTQYLQIKKAAR